jgi:hypothetical protein
MGNEDEKIPLHVARPQKGTLTGQKSNHQHVSCLMKAVISMSAD